MQLDAKKSPLALLAQTCNSIGKDTSSSKSLLRISSSSSSSSSAVGDAATNSDSGRVKESPIVKHEKSSLGKTHPSCSPSKPDGMERYKMSADATQTATGSGPHPKNDMNGVCGSKTASMHADKCSNKDAVTSETNFIGSPRKTSPGLARKTVSPAPQRKLSPSGGKIKTYPAGSGSSHVNKSFHPFPQERFQSPIQHRMTEKESGDRHSPRKHDKGTTLQKSDKSPMDENLARSPSLSELNRLHSPTFGGLTFPSVTDPTLPIRPLLGSYFGLLPFLGQSHVPSPLDLYPSASALSLNGGGLSKLPPSLVSYLHQQSGVVPPRCSAPSSSCKDPCCVECFPHFQTPSVADKLFGGGTTNSDALAQAAVSSLFSSISSCSSRQGIRSSVHLPVVISARLVQLVPRTVRTSPGR